MHTLWTGTGLPWIHHEREQCVGIIASEDCGGSHEAHEDFWDLARVQAWRACLADAEVSFQAQRTAALDAANARRVAVLADKLAILAGL